VKRLEVGTVIGPSMIDAVDPAPMKTMALLLRDPNPIHWDVDVVRQLQLGDQPINQGPINVGFLMRLAESTPAGRAGIRRFSVRFVGNVFAGDRVVCEGRVSAVDEETGLAELELEATVDGKPVLLGTASVLIKSPTD
jgi:acyl dehydratase